MGFPGGSVGKEAACNAGDLGLTPGSGRFPGGGHGNPLQYSCQENPMDRGAWWATFHGVAKSQTQLSEHTQWSMPVSFYFVCVCVCVWLQYIHGTVYMLTLLSIYIIASQVVLVVQNLPANAGDKIDVGFDPWVEKIPWRRKWQPAPVFLPGEFHGQRNLVGYSPWGCKESDMTEVT